MQRSLCMPGCLVILLPNNNNNNNNNNDNNNNNNTSNTSNIIIRIRIRYSTYESHTNTSLLTKYFTTL